ncbi:aminodeoxychorismate/anthranilate synthase component II [Suttonella sp. R2A3]|uniref:anthranilate synthase component II n=1 Tax=Suttonella sp. R2A3 TaxID=2908648 RepID=UPI001F15CC3F|nr:aminodeoxychorismate/anthranilate synthase component II [Suttonella sp. R2A3]UJF23712.1 aminodeoxychorismate/anthranilate synthase component II [Suttonella sp. R2A3]
MLLMIDNHDSFTYNLVRYFSELGQTVRVCSREAISVADVVALNPDYIVISPGPCSPNEAGMSNTIIRHFAGIVPILGVCLGHQCIAQVFGATIERVPPMHGKISRIRHNDHGVFHGLPNPLHVTRYHSLAVSRQNFPAEFDITACSDDENQTIMGIRHKKMALEGVQFHPESFLSEYGQPMLKQFLANKGR